MPEPFDMAAVQPYLDYSHWTLKEAACLLCRQLPLSEQRFFESEINAAGPVGHMYRRLKDAATIPPTELPCVRVPGWVGNYRVLKGHVIAWARGNRIALPPELDALASVSLVEATTKAEASPVREVGGRVVAPSQSDPDRRLALLRKLGGDAKYRGGEWTFSRMKALVESESSEGRARSSEKTIRKDLTEAAQAERDAKNAGFATGLGKRGPF